MNQFAVKSTLQKWAIGDLPFWRPVSVYVKICSLIHSMDTPRFGGVRAIDRTRMLSTGLHHLVSQPMNASRTFWNLALCLTLPLLMASCGMGPTPYQAKKWNGGYTDWAQSSDSQVVWFQANWYTEKSQVSNGALRRGAEYALEKGSARVAVLKKSVWAIAPPMSGGSQPHSAEVVVRVPPKKSDARVYDAADLIRRITGGQNVAATIPDTQFGPSVRNEALLKGTKILPAGPDQANAALWASHTQMAGQAVTQAVTVAAGGNPAMQSSGVAGQSQNAGMMLCDVIYNAGYEWKKVEGIPLEVGRNLRDSGRQITGDLRNPGATRKNEIIKTYPAGPNPPAPRVTSLGPVLPR
jgi:hypothetical protein